VIDALPGLGLDLRAVIANRATAFAIQRAERAGIPRHVLVWDRKRVPRDRYDAELTGLVTATDPDLVLLLGWMHVLPPRFIERFSEMINIHPAFLPYDTDADNVTMPDGAVIPAFRGAHAIADAIAAGSRWYGATAHRVSIEPDRGTILQRAPLLLTEKEEDAALAALRQTEHAVLLGAIQRVLNER
jgi:phosphoribosylglycinamide formyltransferase-1